MADSDTFTFSVPAGATVVEARLQVNQIALLPYHGGHHDPGTNKWVQDPIRLAGRVDMTAKKHGTFGDATPNGNASLTIANTHALDVFKMAFEEALRTGYNPPVFKVYFVLDEKQTD